MLSFKYFRGPYFRQVFPAIFFAALLLASASSLVSVAPGCAYKASDVLTDVEGDEVDYVISGRIVDQQHKPVAEVSVLLWEKEGDLSMEAHSNAAGEFRFEHKGCGKLCLQVLPDQKMKLATALVENLPGEATRKMIVELKAGFLVTGRVVHKNKGLKGLMIRIKPVNPKDTRTKVHGGGVSETGRGGSFSVVLLSGQKKLTVINEKYPDFAKHIETTFTVSDDAHLAPIELP
ncbi:MAG: hypothetical protein KGS72_01580 [Cyanobacteria bacterium REEB67]|nr:hypothetical protein [Cyanobacteria bacterium REEB67]